MTQQAAKPYHLRLRLTQDEAARFQQAAKQASEDQDLTLSVPEWARQVLRKAAPRSSKSLVVTPRVVAEIAGVLSKPRDVCAYRGCVLEAADGFACCSRWHAARQRWVDLKGEEHGIPEVHGSAENLAALLEDISQVEAGHA